MIPTSSHMPPSSGHGPQQNANQLNQQFQEMRLGPGPMQNPSMPHSRPMLYSNNQQAFPTSLKSDMPPSFEYNKSAMSTNVTYSSQPRATYPYVNSNQQYQNAQPNFMRTAENNNQCFTTNAPPLLINQKYSGTQANSMLAQNTNLPNGNHSNRIANGFETPEQHYNSVQSPMHHPQMPPGQNYQNSMLQNQNDQMQKFQQVPRMPLPQQQLGAGIHSKSVPNQQLTSGRPPQPNYQQISHSTVGPPPGPVQNQGPSPQNSSYGPMSSNPPYVGNMVQGGQHQGLGASMPPPPSQGSMPPQGAMPPLQGSIPPQGAMSPHQGALPPPGSMNYGYGPQMPPAPQPKNDLNQMPNFIQVQLDDQKLRGGYYPTEVKGIPPPLVTTNFIVQDRGICSPRFVRASVYCLPNNPDIIKQTAIPFSITVNPLAEICEGEKEPPLCLYREQGPLRCKRCKAYMCPYMNFMEGGRCFQCAFCKVVTEVPEDYFCFLDNMGERTDKYHRPELCLGSYEFFATKEYCRNEELPNPPAYIFMIEVSSATFRNGMVPLLCQNMKNILQALQSDEKNDRSKLRVGFVTYNNVLHFYNMKKNLTQPHIMVLSDVHNAFVPLLEGFLVTLNEATALVDCLMEYIPKLFMNEPATEVILGPVVQVGLEALKNANCSGKLLIFHSTIPNADAPGRLQSREGQKLLGTDKQKVALSPQTDFYSKLAQECVAAGCAVDLFLFPNSYIDIASISSLCKPTGGQLYKYTYFQSHIDGERFLLDLEKNVTTTTAFDAVLRVRTSAGISPIFYYGNFYMSNTTDIELSAIDCHKSVTVEFAYDDTIPENETIYVQVALLYTSCNGERRIRVHNLPLATSSAAADIYKYSELDTIINFFAKQALKHIFDQTPQQIRNSLINRIVKILAYYRKNCTESTSPGQLILPEAMKLLPLFVNCLFKSDATFGGPDITLDDRSFAIYALNSMDVKSTVRYFYPLLIPLHDIDPNSDTTPTPIRCSIEKLTDEGAYLLANGIFIFLWIGQGINTEWLKNVFGVPNTSLIDKQRTSLPELDTPLSKRIFKIIEDIEEGQQWYMKLSIMVQGDKHEIVFRHFLVEDRGTEGSLSHVDFVCHLHREISKIYKNGN